MTALIFDIETSDLLNRSKPLDHPNQPWIMSIAGDLIDDDGNSLMFFHCPVRADGRAVRSGAEAVHGISTRRASKFGQKEVVALGYLIGLAAHAERAVAHGVEFDRDVVLSALIKLGKDTSNWTRPGLEFVCTMKAATSLCRIPPVSPRDDGSCKWPNLDEAGAILLNEPARDGSHSAWDDVQRAKRLFLHLRNVGAIE